jgi:histidyl-tRNA synthetase
MKIQAVRGTNDILPLEVWKWQFLEEKSRKVFKIFGYEEIRTPIFEKTELFIRSAGETSDIVEKQMYTIPEEGSPGLTLRPEATAPVVRAFLEHEMSREDRVQKLYYIGPMFRHERPQKGRLRQFHQIGMEALGSLSPAVDAEVLVLLFSLLEEFGLTGPLLKLNSVGCSTCKPQYGNHLKEFLRSKLPDLCSDCQRRFDKNILRVLDCKNKNCQQILENIPLLPDHICESCRAHFNEVQRFLKMFGIPFSLMPKLVRGLDYYTGTIFEMTHANLGAQDAIAAGGRYNDLIASMDGPSLGAFGFGMGMERILLALGENMPKDSLGPYRPLFFLLSLGAQALEMNLALQNEFRKKGISCEMDFEAKSFKSQLRRADKLGIPFVLIRGEDEIKRNVVKMKDMKAGSEEEIGLDKLIQVIQEKNS